MGLWLGEADLASLESVSTLLYCRHIIGWTYHRLDCRVAASNLNGAVGSVLSKWLVINWKCSSSIFLWSSFVFVLVGTLAVFLLKDIIKY